jgi:hypothetical protein
MTHTTARKQSSFSNAWVFSVWLLLFMVGSGAGAHAQLPQGRTVSSGVQKSPAIPGVTPPNSISFFSGIDLTPSQKTALDAVRKQYSAEFKAFATATNAQLKAAKRRPGPTDRTAANALRQANLDAIKAVLTPAQGNPPWQ